LVLNYATAQIRILKQYRQYMYRRNIETPSRNHCYSGKH